MDTCGYELRIERDIDAGPAEVFDAFLGIYDEPLPDWVLWSRRDLRVGGRWDIAFHPPGVQPFEERRVFTVVDLPRRLQYTATIAAADGPAYETTVTVAATRSGRRTRAALTQSGFPDERTRDEFAAAWPDLFDLIAAITGP